MLFLVLFTVSGFLTLDLKQAYPLTVKTKQPPSAEFWLGTDFFGRNLQLRNDSCVVPGKREFTRLISLSFE